MKALHVLFRWWTLAAFLLAAGALGFAHWVEWTGYPPCHLCLEERKIYWVAALLIAGPASLWALFFRSRGTPRLASFLLFAVFATGAIIATYHTGVELKWWPGPQTCTAGNSSFDTSDLGKLLSGVKFNTPQCDVATVVFAGVSMAGWNAITSVVLALLSLIASMRRKDDKRAA